MVASRAVSPCYASWWIYARAYIIHKIKQSFNSAMTFNKCVFKVNYLLQLLLLVFTSPTYILFSASLMSVRGCFHF